MKTKESRFQVHDELTAPERSVPVLKGALAGGGQLPNFVGVLAGSPAALRAYARFRSELRHGTLPPNPAAHRARGRRAPGQRVRAGHAAAHGRDAGLGLDEIALAREFDSRDEREAVLLRYVEALLESEGPPPLHLHEEAREAGWDRRADARGGRPRGARTASATSSPAPATCRRRLRRGGAPAPGRVARGRSRESQLRLRHGVRPGSGGRAGPRAAGRATACAAPSTTRPSSWSGKRWTGAILFVLMDGPLRFSEVKLLVPDLSDRLLSERLKELEAEGIVERRVTTSCRCGSSTRSPRRAQALEPAVRVAQGLGRATCGR